MIWQQLRGLLNLDPARGMKRASERGMGHGGAERSGLCNNKLLGGPINQTEIASVCAAAAAAAACARHNAQMRKEASMLDSVVDNLQ